MAEDLPHLKDSAGFDWNLEGENGDDQSWLSPSLPLDGFSNNGFFWEDFIAYSKLVQGNDNTLPEALLLDPLCPGPDNTELPELPKEKPAPEQVFIDPPDYFLSTPPAVVKHIGPLTVEERQKKVQRYLEKRLRRTFKKKIAYQCRKRVADGRVRYKGRFVSKALAAQMTETLPDKIIN